jgi:two-component system, chemotaxis family, protein-glutamate methylesterase/glutaminase
MLIGLVSATRHGTAFDVVAIVGSQGALAVACGLVRCLPADFPAAVVYVQHRVTTAGAGLVMVLGHHAAMPVRTIRDGDPITAGTIYVAPPDAQTVVAGEGVFRLTPGRCAGDPLLESVAQSFGARALGVVISGRLSDGSAGLRAIKAAGGRGLIQDPATAVAAGMPTAAMSTGCYDFVLTPERLASAIVALVAVPGAANLLRVRGHPSVAATAA